MPVKELPRFVIYQPNMKEFHICFEAKGEFFRWSSNYAPTLDVRFAREVKRIDNIPVEKLSKKQVFDEGTYMVTKSDTKESAEQKLIDGIDNKTFAFILNGKKLKGRFSFKKVVGGTVLQKYKDQYAVEEDVLLDDLSRTISLMIPNYDESKVKIPTHDETKVKISAKDETKKISPRDETKVKISAKDETKKISPRDETKVKISARAETKVKLPAKDKIKPVQQPKPVIEQPTADKNIGDIDYHFTFYSANKKPDICLVTNASGACVVLAHQGNNWALLQSINRTSSKTEEALVKHAQALYRLRKK